MEQFDRLLVCARVLFLDDYGEIFQLISVVFPFPAVKKKKRGKVSRVGEKWTLSSSPLCCHLPPQCLPGVFSPTTTE